MRNSKSLLSIALIFSGLTACGPRHHLVQARISPTYQGQQKPTLVQEKDYKLAEGSTRLLDAAVYFDSVQKVMHLKGKLEFTPAGGLQSSQNINVDLMGTLEKDGFITLKKLNSDQDETNEKYQLAAKATCLSEVGTCDSSFIDIYLYKDGIVYHHQIESTPAATAQAGVENKQGESVKQNEEKKENVEPKQQEGTVDSVKKDQPNSKKEGEESQGDEDSEGNEGTDVAEGADEPVGELGNYVGSIKEDIEKLFNIPHDNKEDTKAGEVKKGGNEKEGTSKSEDSVGKEDKPSDEKGKSDSKPKEKADVKKDETSSPKNEIPTKKENSEAAKHVPLEKKSQAVGAVNSGRLENAVNLLRYEQNHMPAGFHVMRPERKTHFGTNEISYIISQMGIFIQKEIPEYVLNVGDVSHERGGRLGNHKSHQTGMDADIGYLFKGKGQNSFKDAVISGGTHPDWMADEQWKLFKSAVNSNLIDRIFVHSAVKKALCRKAIADGEVSRDRHGGLAYETMRRLIPDVDHDTHFHIRVKCSSAQIRCRQLAEPAQGTGCF